MELEVSELIGAGSRASVGRLTFDPLTMWMTVVGALLLRRSLGQGLD